MAKVKRRTRMSIRDILIYLSVLLIVCPVLLLFSFAEAADTCIQLECVAGCCSDIGGPGGIGDYKVDLFDAIVMKSEYDRTDCDSSDPELCCKADINADGKVSLQDFVLLQNDFYKTMCQMSAPCTFSQ
jgi:hypothetical protein